MTRKSGGPTMRRRIWCLPFAIVASLLLVGGPARANKDDTILVSKVGALGPGQDGNTYSPPSISADGRYVVFDSDANNLSTEDNNAVINVFVRDLVTNTTTFASRASGPTGAAGDANSEA